MKSEIKFEIELDKDRIPEKIYWDATENPNEGINETKAICLSIWDHYHKGLMGINLWTKDMPVDEMNHFVLDIVGNLIQLVEDSTQDAKLVALLEDTGLKISDHLKELAEADREGQKPTPHPHAGDEPAPDLLELLEQTKKQMAEKKVK